MGAGASSQPISINENETPTFEKTQGDVAYSASQHHDAIAWYTLYLANHTKNSVEVAKVLSNRSAAHFNLGNFGKALDDALQAIDIHPTWTKGYFRATNAAMHLGDDGVLEAREYLIKALALSPTDSTLLEMKKKIFANLKSHELGVGTLYTWGRGDEGQLGHGLSKKMQSLPTMVDALRGQHFMEVAAGAMHTLALTASGNVYAWGGNTHGQCGLMEIATVELPLLIPTFVGRQVVAIACGAGHSIGILSHGQVFSWGIGKQGQLGHGPNVENAPTPREIVGFQHEFVRGVACGISHSVFLTDNHRIHCCGLNSFGQLGLMDAELTVHEPTLVEYVDSIRHVACGGAHTSIVNESGEIWATGSNSCGQLGLGHSDDVQTFTKVPTTSPWAIVVCGEEFSGGITISHQVYMWGLGISGQMGDGEYSS